MPLFPLFALRNHRQLRLPLRLSPRTQPAIPAQPAAQQPNGQQSGDQQYTITTSANEVDLVFTVTDKHGRFIKDLQQRDFALLDDQKAPAQIYSFTQQTNLPLRVGIAIDTSTSIRQRFQFEQQAAAEFLFKSSSRKATRPSSWALTSLLISSRTGPTTSIY